MSAKKILALVAALLLSAALGAAVKISQRHARSSLSETSAAGASASSSAGPRLASPFTVAETVFDGKLGNGWSDWGWGPHDLSHNGPAKVVFGGYGGAIFRHARLDADYGGLSFRYRAPEDWPDFLNVELKGGDADTVRRPSVEVQLRHTARLADGWREVLIEQSELNPEGLPFERIVIAAKTAVGADWVLLDKVVLVKPGTGRVQSVTARNIELAVLCRAPTRPINPMIYGVSGGDWTSGQTAVRIGGNPATRYNWELGAWNAANDWFFENGKSVDLHQMLDEALAHDASMALTVPMIGWVAKDTTSVGFPRSRFAKQRKFDPNRPEAGDGYRPDGTPIPPGTPPETSIPAPPELIGRWIRALRERDGTRGQRSVKMYILDNEPSLWNQTHRDVHPTPLGYDELLDRTLRYAHEVRKADPEALIAGPAEWGWLGYLYSARDREAGKRARPDRLAHGDVPLIPYYLAKIAAREKASGERLLDVLDVHFYPAADRIYGTDARTDAEGAALRLRATRALWDPSYVDESWINEPIGLIPRLKEWIAKYHPGSRTSLGEWSFGADRHISGGLATAEALGRFGQQGLDAAFYWDGPALNTASYWAFRAYRNFDGKGGRFQDLSLATKASGNVSLFASRDAAGSKLVMVVLNLDPSARASGRLNLQGCGEATSQRVFRYVSGGTGLVSELPGAADGKGLSLSLPPYSLTVIDLDTKQ